MTLDTTLLDATRRMTPVIRAHRAHAERARCLAAPVVDAMAEAGLWRLGIKLGHDILATGGDGRRPDWLEAQTTCAAGRTRLGGSLGLHYVVHWTLENVVIATSGSCLDGLSTLR